MTKQHGLFIACGILGVIWLVIQFSGSNPDKAIAIPIDEDVLSDLSAFAARLDDAPIVDVRQSLASIGRNEHDHFDRHEEVYQSVLENGKKPSVREAAIVAWRRAGTLTEPTLTTLVRNDPSEGVRIQAIREIDERKFWRAIPALIDALQDTQLAVRIEAHAAIQHRLGFQLAYDPTQSPNQREHWVRLYRSNFEAMQDLLQAEEELRLQSKATDATD